MLMCCNTSSTFLSVSISISACISLATLLLILILESAHPLPLQLPEVFRSWTLGFRRSTMMLVHVERIASHSCCGYVGGTFMLSTVFYIIPKMVFWFEVCHQHDATIIGICWIRQLSNVGGCSGTSIIVHQLIQLVVCCNKQSLIKSAKLCIPRYLSAHLCTKAFFTYLQLQLLSN